MKFIKEARFGPPKTFKTGSVVGTYPKPMLVFECDSEGLSTIPEVTPPAPPPGYLKIDIVHKDIVYIKPNEIDAWLKKPASEQPKVLAIDFSSKTNMEISCEGADAYAPQKDPTSFPNVTRAVNAVIRHAKLPGAVFPWKTVVLDNTTSLSNFIYGHLASVNSGIFLDARKWAPAIGNKIAAFVQELGNLPCHTVILMHEQTDKNETTGEIRNEPMIYSTYRQIVGGSVSAFFHQRMVNGVPKIITKDTGYTKGLGTRWPLLAGEVGVLFNDIYGASVTSGEIEKP